MISIVLPNYNGMDLLREHLPGILDAAARLPGTEVLVADDASRDGSLDLLRTGFPSVRRVELSRNVGFGAACLEGARAARGEAIFLLNTDVRVDPGVLGPIEEALRDETVFAASAVDLNAGTPEQPREVNRPFFRRGFLSDEPMAAVGPPPFETLYAPGGYAAYRRLMFLELGGFDPVFAPFYREDFDLGYRAWKRGWRSVVEPRSLVWHEHDRGTIARHHRRRRIQRIARRNRFFLVWKSVTSRDILVRKHLPPLVTRLLLAWAVLDFGYYAAFGAALCRLPAVLAGRREEIRKATVTDEELLGEVRRGGARADDGDETRLGRQTDVMPPGCRVGDVHRPGHLGGAPSLAPVWTGS